MRLHIVAQAAHVVVQLPPHRLECVANRHIHILVRNVDFQMHVPSPLLFVFQRRLMRDAEFLARHSEFDADVKWLAACRGGASTITRQLVMRWKYLSSLSASSWTRAATLKQPGQGTRPRIQRFYHDLLLAGPENRSREGREDQRLQCGPRQQHRAAIRHDLLGACPYLNKIVEQDNPSDQKPAPMEPRVSFI